MLSWQVVRSEPGRTVRAREAIARLPYVTEVYAPVMGGDHRPLFWLGSLILVRWDTTDPYTWHEVKHCDGVSHILGGETPMVVSEASLERFKAEIYRLEHPAEIVDEPAPCEAGDSVEFTFLECFLNSPGTCLWASKGVVQIKYRMMGRDHLVLVPYKYVHKLEEINAPQFNLKRKKISVRA